MNLEQNYCFQVFGIFAEKLSSLYFCLVDHWVETVEIWTQVAAQLCKMRKKILLKYAKLIIKYHSCQTNGILYYIVFKFDQVTQNAKNSRSNYEYLKSEGLDIERIRVANIR